MGENEMVEISTRLSAAFASTATAHSLPVMPVTGYTFKHSLDEFLCSGGLLRRELFVLRLDSSSFIWAFPYTTQ